MVGTRGGAGDGADFAGAGNDVLGGAPAACEQGEPAFPEAAQGTLDGVAGPAVNVEVLPAGRLPDWDEDVDSAPL
jgi:hypothetical protein